MTSGNVPCLNPRLCGVQTHRPGTIAKCKATSAKTAGKSQSNLTKAPGLTTSSYDADELRELAEDPQVSNLLAKHDKLKQSSNHDFLGGRRDNDLRMIRAQVADRLGEMGVGESGWNGDYGRIQTAEKLAELERQPDPNGLSIAAMEGGMQHAAKERPQLAPHLQKVWDAGYRPVLAKDIREGAYLLGNDDIINGRFEAKPGNKVARIDVDYDESDDPILVMESGDREEISEMMTVFADSKSLPRYYDYSKEIAGG